VIFALIVQFGQFVLEQYSRFHDHYQ